MTVDYHLLLSQTLEHVERGESLYINHDRYCKLRRIY